MTAPGLGINRLSFFERVARGFTRRLTGISKRMASSFRGRLSGRPIPVQGLAPLGNLEFVKFEASSGPVPAARWFSR